MRHLLVLVALSGTASVASAESPEIYLDIRPSPQGPQIDATIIGAPLVPASAISLRDSYDPSGTRIAATSVRRYAEGSEPIAIAIVFNGAEYFVGNDQYEEDPNAQFVGILPQLEAALDASELTRLGPPGSEVTIVEYSTGASVRVPLQSLAKLGGRALGTEHDYHYKLGADLVSGITLALRELSRSAAPRKAMIVIGDGNDTNNEAAKASLLELKRQAARDNIQTFAIVYKSEISDPSTALLAMIPAAHTVSSADAIAVELASISARLGERYYVTFPAGGLQWDGRDHDLVVQLGRVQADSVTLQLGYVAPARGWNVWWWLQLGIGALLVGGLALLRWRTAAVRAAMAVRAP